MIEEYGEIQPDSDRISLFDKFQDANKEFFLPAGITWNSRIHHLIPNHYLSIGELRTRRFWPREKRRIRTLHEGVGVASDELKNLIEAITNQEETALALTAGLDSRMLLAASRGVYQDFYIYTLLYRNLNQQSNEVKIPGSICKKLGLKHHVLDCRKVPENRFLELYGKNSYFPHEDDWGFIAGNIYDQFPQKHVTIRGACTGITRCYYSKFVPSGSIREASDLISLEPGWDRVPFIQKPVQDGLTARLPGLRKQITIYLIYFIGNIG